MSLKEVTLAGLAAAAECPGTHTIHAALGALTLNDDAGYDELGAITDSFLTTRPAWSVSSEPYNLGAESPQYESSPRAHSTSLRLTAGCRLPPPPPPARCAGPWRWCW